MIGQDILQAWIQGTGNRGAPDLASFLIALAFALLCSIAAILMYNAFYGNEHLGAGVERFFMLGSLAITALFLAIQFSLPLSLGLLGALSIIRFRTPVKDPAEVGFLLLVIAGAVGAATFNYLMVVAVYVLAFAALLGQHVLQGRLRGRGRSYLMVTLDGGHDHLRAEDLNSFIASRFRNARPESISAADGKISVHYQVARAQDFDWGTFKADLERLAAPARVGIFMN